MDALDILQNLYDQIPECPTCNEGCNKCCGSVIMLPIEAERLGLDECVTPFDPDTLKCMFSVESPDPKVHGKCAIYKDRPFTCRIFNAAKYAPFKCPVMDKDGGLDEKQSDEMMNRYFAILGLCPPEHAVRLQEAVLKYAEIMVEHDHRNGWVKENPLTGEVYDNYTGD